MASEVKVHTIGQFRNQRKVTVGGIHKFSARLTGRKWLISDLLGTQIGSTEKPSFIHTIVLKHITAVDQPVQ